MIDATAAPTEPVAQSEADAAVTREGFFAAVYDLVRAVPPGKVTTYGWLARRLQRPQHARLVGYALHSALARYGVPCHRVVNSQGRLSGAPHFGPPGQKAMLESEGVAFTASGAVDLARALWRPASLDVDCRDVKNGWPSADDEERASAEL